MILLLYPLGAIVIIGIFVLLFWWEDKFKDKWKK